MKLEKKKGFHVTITDLTSGKTIIDADSKAILGSVACDDGAHGIAVTACNTLTIINTVNVAEKLVKSTKKEVIKKVPPEIISDLLFGDDDEDEEEGDDNE